LFTAQDGSESKPPFLIMHQRYGSLFSTRELGENLGSAAFRVAVRSARGCKLSATASLMDLGSALCPAASLRCLTMLAVVLQSEIGLGSELQIKSLIKC
jgi:hypothetical protein